MAEDAVLKPSDVSPEVGVFDRFAGAASTFVSRAPFFTFCVLLVLVWAPTLFVLDLNTSQLIINTATTIITFLLVALLQNTATRSDDAVQRKMNAVADGLADLIEFMADHTDVDSDCVSLRGHARELRAAVGLETRTST